MSTSVELSKKIFKKTLWEGEGAYWGVVDKVTERQVPAYSLVYLLDKLPVGIVLKKRKGSYSARPEGIWTYKMMGLDKYKKIPPQEASTPEDACGLLVLELVKIGVVGKGSL